MMLMTSVETGADLSRSQTLHFCVKELSPRDLAQVAIHQIQELSLSGVFLHEIFLDKLEALNYSELPKR